MSVSTAVPPGAARPAPGHALLDPVLASQQIFRQLLDALANPGTSRPGLVQPAVVQDQFSGNRFLASALMTLVDHEVSVHVDATVRDGDELARLLRRRTRVPIEPASEAAFVVADASTVAPQLLLELRRGTLAYPDDGATLVLDIKSIAQREAHGLVLECSGPGIETSRTVSLPAGINAAVFEARNQAVAQYPLGIDLLLIDGTGQMVGLPRTTLMRIQPEGDR